MSSKILSGGGASSRPSWRRVREAPLEAKGEEERRQAENGELERQAGYRQGFRDGEAEAARKASLQFASECERVAAQSAESVAQILALRLRMREQMEADLATLSIAVARRILHRELQVDPEAVLGIVRAAVGKVESRQLHRLRVAEADLGAVERSLETLRLPAQVKLLADPSLPRGSLILETTRGQLDASVETQLSEIERGLADLVRRGSP